jgi:hypothetical protein
MRQLSPKEEEDTYIKYSSNTSALFFKRPEQSATPKDIPPCGEKTFALWVRVALMNI